LPVWFDVTFLGDNLLISIHTLQFSAFVSVYLWNCIWCVVLHSVCSVAANDAVCHDDKMCLLQSARMSASNMQQDGGRLWEAAGRKALALLCTVD